MAVKPIVHTSDVLIIGGGFSGMWAAIRASQQGRSVLVVDKGPRDWRGLGMVSGGDMIVMQPEFDVKDLLDELVYYYDGLCDQEQLAVILEASYDRFRDLENWGHIFARDEKGTLLYVPQRGLSFMLLLSLSSLRQGRHPSPRTPFRPRWTNMARGAFPTWRSPN